MDDVQLALERYKTVCDPSVPFTYTCYDMEGLLGLAAGNINCIVRAINKLLKFLPIVPIDGEAIRAIFERAAIVIRNA